MSQIVKPSTLPGFLELLPKDQILFNKMKDKIRDTYESFGFIPLDTPLIEKSEVLLAKGGGETEKQIYRFTKGDTDMSLRFDLTVPLARYVAEHFSDLAFPFRRYHIGKVYRGEKSQKGRFREFYQCDIDIIGNGKLSIVYDAEILSVIYSTFKNLGFESFTVRINNRKILNGFFKSQNIVNVPEVLRSIDKLEKIGESNVAKELKEQGIDDDTINKLLQFIKIKGNNDEIIDSLKALSIENDLFKQGLDELSKVVNYIRSFNIPENNFSIDLTIARGLDYYTGTVYETFLNDYPEIGSVCSGGRYENLAEFYTKQKLPGVGISIGLTRLFYQLREADIIKTDDVPSTPSQVLLVPMEESHNTYCIEIGNNLRKYGIVSEIYFNDAKMGKKLTYANKQDMPFAILIGEDEVKNKSLTLKNMKSGDQEMMSIEEAVNRIKPNIRKME